MEEQLDPEVERRQELIKEITGSLLGVAIVYFMYRPLFKKLGIE